MIVVHKHAQWIEITEYVQICVREGTNDTKNNHLKPQKIDIILLPLNIEKHVQRVEKY